MYLILGYSRLPKQILSIAEGGATLDRGPDTHFISLGKFWLGGSNMKLADLLSVIHEF